MTCSPLIGIQILLNNDPIKKDSMKKLIKINVQFQYHKNKVEGVVNCPLQCSPGECISLSRVFITWDVRATGLQLFKTLGCPFLGTGMRHDVLYVTYLVIYFF